jgi:hypothetical protein
VDESVFRQQQHGHKCVAKPCSIMYEYGARRTFSSLAKGGLSWRSRRLATAALACVGLRWSIATREQLLHKQFICTSVELPLTEPQLALISSSPAPCLLPPLSPRGLHARTNNCFTQFPPEPVQLPDTASESPTTVLSCRLPAPSLLNPSPPRSARAKLKLRPVLVVQ